MDKTKIFALVEKAAVAGKYDKALEQLEVLLRSDPSDLKALNRAADLYLKTGSNEKAIDYLKRIGQSYTKDGFYSKAVAVYKRILKLNETAPKGTLIEVHEQLASLYGQLGLVSDAMSHFAIVVDYFDTVGDQEGLLRSLKKVSDLDPYNVDSQLKLAELFLAQKKTEEADVALTRIEENLASRGNRSELLRVYERTMDLFPNDVQRLGKLVDFCLKANEPKKALARIQVAFRNDPKNPEVLELLSSTFQALKQPEKSRSVDYELVKIYRQTGDADRLKAAENRLQMPGSAAAAPAPAPTSSAHVDEAHLDPADALLAQMQLSTEERKVLSECDVYFKYGLAEKAFDVLKSYLDRYPESLALRWKLTRAATEMKRREEAIQLLSEVLLLAKTKNLTTWVEMASKELAPLDPHHPALAGLATSANASQRLKPNEETATTTRKSEPVEEASEVSLVLDEAGNSISEISFQVDDEIVVEPEMESSSLPTPKSDSPVSETAEESSGEAFLTEADFSASELDQLSNALEPETSAPKNVQKEEDVSQVLELSMEPEIEISAEQTFEEESSTGADSDFEIRQGLEEVAFFKQQGLHAEADTLLQSLKAKFPQWKDWSLKAAEVKPAPSKPAAAAASPVKKKTTEVSSLGTKMKLAVQEDDRAEDADDFYDFAAELNKELAQDDAPQKSAVPTEVRDVFSAFKKGVASAVSADDWQTHLDLGVAYREMGLMDDAIEEFTLVSKVSDHRPKAFYQMGLCEMGKSNFSKAKEHFSEALQSPHLKPDERISLSYELAEALLALNDVNGAKKLFAEVQKLDPEFREVTERLQKLA